VEEDAAATREFHGETFYFDTQACAYSFDARPEEYRRRAKEGWPDPSLWEPDRAGARSSEVRDRR
jgi:YHS domain-containing protein